MQWFPGAPAPAPHFHEIDIPGVPKTAAANERPLEPPFRQRSGDELARRRRATAGGSKVSGVLAESSSCSGQERFAGVGVINMALVVESSCSDANELALPSAMATLGCPVCLVLVAVSPNSRASAAGTIFVAAAM